MGRTCHILDKFKERIPNNLWVVPDIFNMLFKFDTSQLWARLVVREEIIFETFGSFCHHHEIFLHLLLVLIYLLSWMFLIVVAWCRALFSILFLRRCSRQRNKGRLLFFHAICFHATHGSHIGANPDRCWISWWLGIHKAARSRCSVLRDLWVNVNQSLAHSSCIWADSCIGRGWISFLFCL